MCKHGSSCATCSDCARVYCHDCGEPGFTAPLHLDHNTRCHACCVKGPVREVRWYEDAAEDTLRFAPSGTTPTGFAGG